VFHPIPLASPPFQADWDVDHRQLWLCSSAGAAPLIPPLDCSCLVKNIIRQFIIKEKTRRKNAPWFLGGAKKYLSSLELQENI